MKRQFKIVYTIKNDGYSVIKLNNKDFYCKLPFFNNSWYLDATIYHNYLDKVIKYTIF